jgi:Mg/Co/Ni transporter MgtE
MTFSPAGDALARMEFSSAAALVCRLPTSKAVALLFRQGLPLRLSLIQACPEPWRTSLAQACHMNPGSVGTLLNKAVTVAPSDWSIAKTRRYLAAHPQQTSFEIFVVDREWRLTGRTDLQRLAIHTEARLMGGIVDPNPASLRLRSSIAAIREDRLWQRFDVLPVTDEGGLVLGSVSHRAIRSLQGTMEGLADPNRPGAGTAVVDAAELAWTGYLAALDVAALMWRSAAPLDSGPTPEKMAGAIAFEGETQGRPNA